MVPEDKQNLPFMLMAKIKLRTYRTFKQSFETEDYVKNILSHKARQALAKFRCGVASFRIETGQYVWEREENRLCVV